MRLSLFLVSMIFSVTAIAGGNVYRHSDDTLQKLYSELHYLNQVGHEIHNSYDEKVANDPQQLRFCEGEYGYVGTRARATIGIANLIESPNKEEYIATGWKAYQCIKCSGDISHCDAIPPALETIKAEYNALQSQ